VQASRVSRSQADCFALSLPGSPPRSSARRYSADNSLSSADSSRSAQMVFSIFVDALVQSKPAACASAGTARANRSANLFMRLV